MQVSIPHQSQPCTKTSMNMTPSSAGAKQSASCAAVCKDAQSHSTKPSLNLGYQLFEWICQRCPLPDNGRPMKRATMRETLYRLGVTPSNSRSRISNDNPYVESLFKTIKYNSGYLPKGFASIEKAREWVSGFVSWYNNKNRHGGIKYLMPDQRHSKNHGLDILERRKHVYESCTQRTSGTLV